MVRLLLMYVCCALATVTKAQSDSVVMENITIRALLWQEYAAGLKVESINIHVLGGQSLADALNTSTSTYIKAYGPGQLSTLSIRGTSASQNALFWEGINVNVTSLGLTDFSLTPTALVDNASIQFGASSSLLGSDAIGGSIHLYNEKPRETKLTAMVGGGSFGANQQRISGSASLGKFTFGSKIFRQSGINNFPYRNPTKRGNPKEIMENAAFHQWGLAQDMWWDIATNHQLSLHLWHQSMDRDIQPTFAGANRDHQDDQTSRLLLKYRMKSRVGSGTLKVARMEDRINFNGDLSIMPRSYLSYEHEYASGEKLTHKIGGNIQQLQAEIAAYGQKTTEWRKDVYYSVKYNPTNRFLVTSSVRQSMVEGYNPPITPSLGWEYAVGKRWAWQGNVARSYRVPTLNDLYWQPGGNLDLLPESGNHIETGLRFSNDHFKSKATVYGGKVKDWIIWLPGEGYWSPENIDRVAMYGLEYQWEWELQPGLAIGANYALNKSIREKSSSPSFEGKQLPYLPVHQVKGNVNYQYKGLKASLLPQWTSARYTTADNEYQLSGFFLVNAHLSTLINEKWQINAYLNNISNQAYQLMESRAMPGRNFNLSIIYTFNFKQS